MARVRTFKEFSCGLCRVMSEYLILSIMNSEERSLRVILIESFLATRSTYNPQLRHDKYLPESFDGHYKSVPQQLSASNFVQNPKRQIVEQTFLFLQPSVNKLKACSIISREKDTLYFLLCNGRRTKRG